VTGPLRKLASAVKPSVVIAAAALVLVAAGCGKSTPPLYTRAATTACLQKAGLHPVSVTGSPDFVAQSATGGAFFVRVGGNRVTVSFGQTVDDADNLNQAYRRFRAGNIGINDVLQQQGNAVMLWRMHPQDTDISTVTGCLKA
jgi:hypothetical protein